MLTSDDCDVLIRRLREAYGDRPIKKRSGGTYQHRTINACICVLEAVRDEAKDLEAHRVLTGVADGEA